MTVIRAETFPAEVRVDHGPLDHRPAADAAQAVSLIRYSHLHLPRPAVSPDANDLEVHGWTDLIRCSFPRTRHERMAFI